MVGSVSDNIVPWSKGVYITIDSQFKSVNRLLQSIGLTFPFDARQMAQSKKRNQSDHPGSVNGKLHCRVCCLSSRDSDQVPAENKNCALAEQRLGASILLFRFVCRHQKFSVWIRQIS
jgi:hypothetical protein